MLHGVDVSAYQASFETDGLDFVFIKATEGRSYINPRLAAQAKRARDAECVVGFYHFLWPGNITAQAEYFLSKAPEKAGELLAVDWEQNGEGTHASNAEKDRFIREVKRLRPHHKVLLYCNRYFWLNHDTTSYAGDEKPALARELGPIMSSMPACRASRRRHAVSAAPTRPSRSRWATSRSQAPHNAPRTILGVHP
ncbi:GH25 family lysozyme [Streptomyces sp. NPDC050422]|uniref:GH25 family lysozyme n=1 Tax=Streptomyces sp. NPDC050422 TaxID=3365614 RepID=UPI003787EA04